MINAAAVLLVCLAACATRALGCTLSYPQVLSSVSSFCLTDISKSKMLSLSGATSGSAGEASELYDMLEEMKGCHGDIFPPAQSDKIGESLASCFSVLGDSSAVALGGVLTLQDIVHIRDTLRIVNSCEEYFERADSEGLSPTLCGRHYKAMQLNGHLLKILDDSFDWKLGALSHAKYPHIGRLSGLVRDSNDGCMSALKAASRSLQRSKGGSSAEEDAGFQRVNRRWTLAVDSTSIRKIGIAHSLSRTGKTAYVEPFALVPQNNKLLLLEDKLDSEILEIMKDLTAVVMHNRDSVWRSVESLIEMDMVRAKMLYGSEGGCFAPSVGDEGVIDLKSSSHPLIKSAVSNDIKLGDETNKALALTGPNSSGKTVLIKQIALCALMVKDGIPLKMARGGRFDYFENVLHDIGDIQDLSQDLSTFGAHVKSLNGILDKVEKSNATSLVLLDEIGKGTSPEQGAALGRAVLERLVDHDARVAVTTHFLQVKHLATENPYFRVGGMEFLKGQPTYRVIMGSVGESFALSVAERMGMPASIVERAHSLMSSEARMMSEMAKNLQDEKVEVEKYKEDLKRELRVAADAKEGALKLQAKLNKEKVDVRLREARKFAKEVEQGERALQGLLAELERKTGGEGKNTVKVVGKTWSELKLLRRGMLGSAVGRVDEAPAKLDAVPLKPKDKVKLGERLIVLPPNSPFASKVGEVVGGVGSKKIELSFGAITSRFKITDLGRGEGGENLGGGNGSADGGRDPNKVSKRVMQEEASIKKVYSASTRKSGSKTMRLDSNTLDLRGQTADDSILEMRAFFSQMMSAGRSSCYVLHGHGPGGVLKQKIRHHLQSEPLVDSFCPAPGADGGDAFTMIVLKDSLLV